MKYLFIILALLTFSCESNNQRTIRISDDESFQFNLLVSGKESFHLHYGKDKRTNLCFAYNRLNWNSALFTSVPCTPEVEKILGQ